MNLCTTIKVSIQAILGVNTFSQTHAEEAATIEMWWFTLLKMWRMLHQMWQCQSSLVEHSNSLSSCHEPEPYVRTAATNGDHDATAATTAPGADKNDNYLDNEHEYVNTETDIYKQCSKQLLYATNVGTNLTPNTRFKKQ